MASSRFTDTTVVLADGQAQVNSVILCMASPVFEAMLTSNMKESQTQEIQASNFSLKDFDTFYNFLVPGHGRAMSITDSNVEQMLKLSDYYQVLPIKGECETFLLGAKPTLQRLLLTKQHNLQTCYERYADAISLSVLEAEVDLKPLSAHVEVLLDVVGRTKGSLSNIMGKKKRKLEELASKLYSLPDTNTRVLKSQINDALHKFANSELKTV